ncbi:hypothetical protein, partial [Hyphococcus sp.]
MTNGTTVGTVMLQDIEPGSVSSNPRDLTAVKSQLFFTAENSS